MLFRSTSTYQRSVNRLLIDGGFNSFVYNYYLQHRQQVDQYATATAYAKGFTNGEEMWNGLVNYAAKDSINLKGVGEKEKESLRQRLKALLARYKWRNDGFYQVLNMDDEMVKKALETMAK